MHNPSLQGIIILISGITILLLLFTSFIVTLVYKYQQKQNAHIKDIEALNTSHENALLLSQLEIQEQTFQHISREMHDNIGQKLTLAKLYLNTLKYQDGNKTMMQINDTINIMSEAISDLSNISRSMSCEIILNNGLIKALEYEFAQLEKPGKYKINFSVRGNPVFLKTDTELLLFRITQEALNNIIKHADASQIYITLDYNDFLLSMTITDNGKGFDSGLPITGTGIQNIKKRVAILKGCVNISSKKESGTQIKIEIPLYENKQQL